ncbi:MAG: nucleoside phosphorylase [Terracidiphilus sp.]
MTRTAIIAAMRAELKPLVQGWKHARRNGVDTWAHRDDNLYVAACAGTGHAAATRAFAAIEESAPIDLVFSIGWAGALTTECAPGNAYNVGGVIDARTGERFQCDAGAGKQWLVTSPLIAGPEEKRRLAAAYNADLVDMEAAAIARLAAMRGIPFYAIKGVSDAHDARLPDMNPFLAHDGRFRTARFTLYALLRPWHWQALAHMGENSKKAAEAIAVALCDFLQ